MKKLLGMALAVALLIPPGPAGAEMLKNLKISGQWDVQGNSGRNIADFSTRKDQTAGGGCAATGCNDRVGNALTRLLLNADWDMLEDVHAKVSLRKNDRTWGTVGGTAATGFQGAAGGQGLIGAPAAGSFAANLVIQQANLKIDKVFGRFDTTLGRQYYGNPGDLIIYYGPTDTYGLFVTAIDAMRVDTSNDWMNFTGMAGTTAGPGGLAVMPNASTNVRGFDVGWKNLPIKVNTFVWNRVIQGAGALGAPPTNATAVTGLNDNLWVYGAKAHGEAMGGWITGTVALNGGEDRTTLAGVACGTFGPGCYANTANYQGKALLVDAGWNTEVSNVGGFTPWANFGWGSGRSSNLENKNEGFTSIASDFRPGIINRRFGPASALNLGATMTNGPVGTGNLNNRVVWGLGLKFKPTKWEKLTLEPSIWDYRFQRGTFVSRTGTLASGNKHIGTEFGMTADWKHSENVSMGVGWATFQTGGYIENSVASDAPASQHGSNPATLAFADFTVKF